MKIGILTLLLISGSSSGMVSWQDIIDQHQNIMGKETYEHIALQHFCYENQLTPKIDDPAIMSIPIKESNEPIFDIKEAHSNVVSMLPNPENPLASPDCNSGYPDACKVRRSLFSKLVIMTTLLDKHAADFGYQKNQVRIKVFEGLRKTETCTSPLPNNVPAHATGGSVDIRLWDALNKSFLDMGSFSPVAAWGDDQTAPTFSEKLTTEQKKNRLYLLIAATKAKLVNYPFAWWHLSSGDRYASFVQEKDSSQQKSQYDAY